MRLFLFVVNDSVYDIFMYFLKYIIFISDIKIPKIYHQLYIA